jgi:hypothetical protein
LFLVGDTSFCSQDQNVLSLFQSSPYESTCTFNMNAIHPFLDHILNIICNHDLDLYSYIINWISYLIQKPGSKLRQHRLSLENKMLVKISSLLMLSPSYLDVMLSHMRTTYAISLRGFNSSIENKILIVCNELHGIDSTKDLNTDCLQSLITRLMYIIKIKFINNWSINNVSNFILLGNYHLLKNEKDGRRYFDFKFRDDTKGNFDYFEKLYNLFDELFDQHFC